MMTVTVADPLMAQGPATVRRLASLYSPMIQRSRVAWGAVYHSSNTKPTFAAIRAVFGRGVRKVTLELIKKHDPDVLLSVHPLLNHMTHQAIQKSGRPRALMTVITDLVDFHRGWTFSQADLVVAPTEQARRVAIRRRVPPDRVKLLGLPVDLRFRPPAPGEKEAMRRRFGLDESRFTILVMGGAAGAGSMLKQVSMLAWERQQWQVVAVCGRNEKLRARLASLGVQGVRASTFHSAALALLRRLLARVLSDHGIDPFDEAPAGRRDTVDLPPQLAPRRSNRRGWNYAPGSRWPSS